MKWFTYLRLGFWIVSQLANAAQDGKITVKEVVDIASRGLNQLGISIMDKGIDVEINNDN